MACHGGELTALSLSSLALPSCVTVAAFTSGDSLWPIVQCLNHCLITVAISITSLGAELSRVRNALTDPISRLIPNTALAADSRQSSIDPVSNLPDQLPGHPTQYRVLRRPIHRSCSRVAMIDV